MTDEPDVQIEKKKQQPVDPVIANAHDSRSLLDTIVKSAKKEAESKGTKRKNDIQISEIEDLWRAYQQKAQSPSVVGVLQHKKFELQKNELKITVPSEVAKKMISEEYKLMTSLRQIAPNDDFNIQLMVDKEAFEYLAESESNTPITFEDKLDHLKNKNPMITELIKQLKLKKDNY